jgi:DNA-binding CsgD family transcriptional regulator
MIVDLKRLYLELRPRLTRVYAVVADWERNGPVMRVMGFGRIGDEIFIGERGFHLCVLDFGPGSVDGWLARHVLVESELPSVSDAGGALSRPDPPGHPDPLRHPDPTGHPDLPAPPALPPAADRPPVGRLSAREREVLAALADGLTNMELANRLFISERTANRHLSNIFTKLGVRNRTAAARIAIEAGLAG